MTDGFAGFSTGRRSDLLHPDDRAGMHVNGWRCPDDVLPLEHAGSVCHAPWRRASGQVVELLLASTDIARGGMFVDLGCGDGSVVNGVLARSSSNTFGLGVDASGPLVLLARRAARAAPHAARVRFLHEQLGRRGLAGATVVYAWLFATAAPLVSALVREAATVRYVVWLGDPGPGAHFPPGDVVGRVHLEPSGPGYPVWVFRWPAP